MLSAVRKRQELPAQQLAHHVFSTYASVRYGMAAIAAAFPAVLVIGGLISGVELQASMSAYYWADAGSGYPPMRIWFVGILFVVGVFLYLYKGFTPLENHALNTAAACAFGVALVPMAWKCEECHQVNLHGAFAVLLFLCIAYVSIGRAKDTLVLVEDATLKARYRRAYRILGIVMILSPLTAFATTILLTGSTSRYVFFIETAGIYAFAAYWYLKSRELARTNAELSAVRGNLEATDAEVRPVDPAGAAVRTDRTPRRMDRPSVGFPAKV
jgi:hypothetical protein